MFVLVFFCAMSINGGEREFLRGSETSLAAGLSSAPFVTVFKKKTKVNISAHISFLLSLLCAGGFFLYHMQYVYMFAQNVVLVI